MYPIKTVAEITGINPVTLRAWERRYGLIQPQRTPKGHRLYSQKNVDEIKKVLRLLDRGIAISQMGEQLQQDNAEDDELESESSTVWKDYQSKIIDAIENFDETQLEIVYSKALSLYPIEQVTRELLLPLLFQLGERWSTRDTGVAEEHFFSMYMHNKLGAQFHHLSMNQRGPVLLVACVPGEHHTYGLMLFALAARLQGYKVILLGANMPLEELPAVAQKVEARAIALSSSKNWEFVHQLDPLENLVTKLNIPLFLGGKSSTNYRLELKKIGVEPIGEDIGDGLKNVIRFLEK